MVLTWLSCWCNVWVSCGHAIQCCAAGPTCCTCSRILACHWSYMLYVFRNTCLPLVLHAVRVQEHLLAAGPTCCTCSGILACHWSYMLYVFRNTCLPLVLRAVHVQEYLLAAGLTCCTCSGILACRWSYVLYMFRNTCLLLVLHAVHVQEHLLAAVCCSSLYWWDSTSLLAYHIRAVTMYLSRAPNECYTPTMNSCSSTTFNSVLLAPVCVSSSVNLFIL